MNATQNNILSRIEREYISFLYNQARSTTNQPVTITQIQDFVQTEEGQRGLESFRAMRSQRSQAIQDKKPQQIGAFL